MDDRIDRHSEALKPWLMACDLGLLKICVASTAA